MPIRKSPALPVCHKVIDMKISDYMLVIVAGAICGAMLLFCPPQHGKAQDVVYEVRPQVAVPYGYVPEQSRLIDLLERMLADERQLTFEQLCRLEDRLIEVSTQLDDIQKTADSLSHRLTAIEDALGIQPADSAVQGGLADPSPTPGPVR